MPKRKVEQYNLELKQLLKDSLRPLIQHGYKCYFNNDESGEYEPGAHLITPSGNILNVCHDYFGGWRLYFEYKPDRCNGEGCYCFEKVIFEFDLDTVQRAEAAGRNNALRFCAKLYKDPDEWFRGYWSRDRLVLLA